MSAQFTDDDLEKTVEDVNGETIGTVTSVEGDVAQVEPRASVLDSIRATLGWTGTQETVSIHDNAAEKITDEVIRLETASLDADEAAGATTDEAEETEPADGELDETDRSTRLDSDEAATRDPETDRLETEERRESSEATASSPETTATEGDLEDELNRGTKVEPPKESEVRDAVDETCETAGGETAEMTDVPEELATNEEHDSPESDSIVEGTERSEPDEPDRGESSADAGGTNAIDEPRGGEASEADDVTDDAEPGRTEDDESGTERETEEMDLAAEFDRGADLDAVEEDSPSEGPESGVGEQPTEEMDLAEELDQGVDVESAAETEDHRTDEPATADEPVTDEEDRSGEGRGGVESPIGAMSEAQQAVIKESQQLFEGSLAVQRDVNRIALSTLRRQMALQRQGIELFQTMVPDPVEAAKAMGPPGASLEDHRSTESAADSSESADREGTFERRLELVDGLDSMYRERLQDAGITTLDDLAYADAETVAQAAEVTEERAESWIEQAAA